MERTKKLYILLGILFLLCIAAFAVNKYEAHKELIENSSQVIINIESSKVKSLSWEYKSGKLSFQKDQKWTYNDDSEFPVNEDKINTLLEQFEEFGVSFIIRKVQNYGQYGLDSPECTIEIKTQDKDYKIQLGGYSKMDSERYVSIGDGNVYLAKNDPLDYFNITLDDIIDHDTTPAFNNVEEIEFTGEKNNKITYKENNNKAYSEDDVYFMEQDGNSLPLDTTRINNYLSAITSLSLEDYVTYKASDKDLKEYGLGQPDISINIKYKPASGNKIKSFVLNAGCKPEEKSTKRKSDDKEKEAYVRIGNSKIIYKIPFDDYKELIKTSYNDLRHKEILPANLDEIYKVDISLEGRNYTITSKGKKDKRTYYYKDEELEINNLKNTLENLKAEKFTEKQPSQKEEINLTVYLDNNNYPEVNIILYRYNGSSCIASVNGVTTALVEREDVINLVEAVNKIILDK